MNKVERFRVAASPFRTRYDNFIGGVFTPPKAGRYFDNTSPVTGQVLCEIARSDAADVEAALDAAHAAKVAWGRTSVAERAVILNRIADRMRRTRSSSPPPRPGTTASPSARPRALTCPWPWTTSAASRAPSARRKGASPRSTTTRSPTASTSPWGSWARSSPGTSRS